MVELSLNLLRNLHPHPEKVSVARSGQIAAAFLKKFAWQAAGSGRMSGSGISKVNRVDVVVAGSPPSQTPLWTWAGREGADLMGHGGVAVVGGDAARSGRRNRALLHIS